MEINENRYSQLSYSSIFFDFRYYLLIVIHYRFSSRPDKRPGFDKLRTPGVETNVRYIMIIIYEVPAQNKMADLLVVSGRGSGRYI